MEQSDLAPHICANFGFQSITADVTAGEVTRLYKCSGERVYDNVKHSASACKIKFDRLDTNISF